MSDFSQHFQPSSATAAASRTTEAFIHHDEEEGGLVPSNNELPSSEEFAMSEDYQQLRLLPLAASGPLESFLYKEDSQSVIQSPNGRESTLSDICHHLEFSSAALRPTDVFDYEDEDDDDEEDIPSNVESPSSDESTVSEVRQHHHQQFFSESSQASSEAFIHQREDITPSIITSLHGMISADEWKTNAQDSTESPGSSSDATNWPHHQLRHIVRGFLHTWSRTYDGAGDSASVSASAIPSPPPDSYPQNRGSAQRLRLARETLDKVNQVEHFLTIHKSNGNGGGRRKGDEKADDDMTRTAQDYFLAWVKVLLNKLVWACYQTVQEGHEE